jgi:hypothetical protein
MRRAKKTEIKYLFIEVTNFCNFSCTFCPDARMRRKREFMDRATVLKIISEAAEKRLTSEPLQFHLMGEPLLAKDLFAYIERAHGLGLAVRLLTNGSLLNETTAGKIFSARVGELVIGIQTWGEESFRLNRRGKIGYAAYMENIRKAIELKFAVRAGTKIHIHYLNTKHFNRARAEKGYAPVFSPGLIDDDAQALQVIGEWKEFAASVSQKYSLGFAPRDLECLAGELGRHPLDCLCGDHCEILPGVILGFKAISPFSDWLMKDVRYVERHRGTCPSIREQFAVLADGTCTPCCVDYEGEMGVGNVARHGVARLWNSPAARRAREKMRAGLYPHRLCRICKAFVVADDYHEKMGDGARPFELVDGFYNLENDGERDFRWTGKTARIRVQGDFSALKLELRNMIPALESNRITVSQGKNAKTFTIRKTGWVSVVFPLRRVAHSGDLVEIESGELFVPHALDKNDPDARELALMVGSLELA